MCETTEINVEQLRMLLVCAVRYACGRRTYMPSTVVGAVREHLPHLRPEDRKTIAWDIIHTRDLGDPCDERLWKDLLREMEPQRMPSDV